MSLYFQEDNDSNAFNSTPGLFTKASRYFYALNDKLQYYKKERWAIVGFLGLIYLIRLITTKGYHALTYCIGIHFLNSFIGFISPLQDPEDDIDGGKSFLPQK